MRLRILSAGVIGVLLVSAILWLPAAALVAVLSLILLAAAWEWSGLVGARGVASRLVFLLLVAALAAVWWQVSARPAGLQALLWAGGLSWLLAALWVARWPLTSSPALGWVAGCIALPLAWVALARMRMDWALGQHWVLYTLCIVWAADSGAYFVGRALGRRKLAPRVSPGKTWAGFWGGLASAALLGLFVAPLLGQPRLALAGVTVVVALFSVVGDLTESLLKRHAGVKDSGNLIPGHGGMLDRFDSLLAASPLLALAVTSLGLVP